MLFSTNAEENMRATVGPRRGSKAAINAAKVGSGATRYGPALKLAESILSRSPIKRREAMLISDFQRSGWSGSEDVRFPEGMTLTHRVGRVADDGEPRGAVGGVRALVVLRTGARHRDRRARATRATQPLEGRAGHADDRRPRNPDREGDDRARTRPARSRSRSSRSSSRTCAGSVRAGTDPLPADNTFNFVLAPSEPVSLVDRRQRRSRGVEPVSVEGAVDRHDAGRSRSTSTSASRLTPATLDKRVGRHPERHDVAARPPAAAR